MRKTLAWIAVGMVLMWGASTLWKRVRIDYTDFKLMRAYISQSDEFRAWAARGGKPLPKPAVAP